MSEILKLLSGSKPAVAQAISACIESSGISVFIMASDIDSTNSETVTNIYVKENDYYQALILLNNYNNEVTSSESLTKDNQAFNGLIIVPVDFSPACENACYYAVELASKFKTRLKLIHTYGIPDFGPFILEEGEFYRDTINVQIDENKVQLEEKLGSLQTKLKNHLSSKKLEDVTISKILMYGLPDETAIYASEYDQASLIILGISNENSVYFATAGKIVSRIIEKTKIPVLIIPEDNTFTGVENIKNILYLTSFDESDFSAIHKLISIANNLKIFCLHIERGEINPWDKIKMDGLKEYFKSSYNINNVTCDLLSSDNMLQTIDDYIKKNNIDIISVINHKQSTITKLINPGLAKKILIHTHIPLFVFHD